MHYLLSKVRDTINREALLNNRDEVLIAISGGADSVALLMALSMLGYKVLAAHCNFHLRGDESDDDEIFVKLLCRKLKIELYTTDFDTIEYSKIKGISIEMAARELRYKWFRELSISNNNIPIAIAHNSDDNIETLLLNLASGTGIRGLSGIPYKRDGYIIRPLMDCSRDDILRFLRDNNQEYRYDSSNDDTKYKRNLIRHNIIPLFEDLNQSFRRTMYSNVNIFDFNNRVYELKIEELRNNIISNDDIYIDKLINNNFPKSNLLFELLRPYNFTMDICESMQRHIYQLSSGKEFLSSSHKIITYSNIWQIIPLELFSDYSINIDISCSGNINTSLGLLSWDILDSHNIDTLYTEYSEAIFDYDALINISNTLEIRSRKEADNIKPYGMKGKRKLISRILIDGKYSPRQRVLSRVLSINDYPLWLIGIKPDSTFKVSKQTNNIIKFSITSK